MFFYLKMDRFPMRSSLFTGYRCKFCLQKLTCGSLEIRAQSLKMIILLCIYIVLYLTSCLNSIEVLQPFFFENQRFEIRIFRFVCTYMYKHCKNRLEVNCLKYFFSISMYILVETLYKPFVSKLFEIFFINVQLILLAQI